MEASFMITQVETTMSNYRNQYHRSGTQDLAIWQSIDMYYSDAGGHDLIATSTREEAFDQMVKDKWTVSHDYHGLDYETIDEAVLQYLEDNALVKRDNADAQHHEKTWG